VSRRGLYWKATIALLGALVGSGCDSPPDVGDVSHLPVHSLPVRAVEVIDDAHFIVPPPDPPAPEVLQTFDFNDPTAALARWNVEEKHEKRHEHQVDTESYGWNGTPGLRVGPKGGEKDELCVPVTTRMPVPTGGRYQVTTRVRTRDIGGEKLKAGAGLEVVALSGDKDDPKVESRHITTTRLRGTTDDWETLTLTVDAERKTRALELNLLRCTGRGAGYAVFDDLSVATVPQQAAALDAPGVSPVHRAEPHPLVRRLNPDDDHRPGILTLTPTTWVLRVDRSEAANLHLGFAVDDRSPKGSRVCFRVDEVGGGRLVRRCVGPDHDTIHKEGEGWVDTVIALPAKDGPSTLVFSATAEGTPEGVSAIGYWGNPRVIPVKRTAPVEEKPDIVLFVFDTLRRDHLGFSGYDLRPSSPNLDAFAATAWDFTQASSPAGWTLPSGSTIITGRYPMTHGGGWRVRRDVQALKVSDVQKKHARTLDFTSIADDIPTLAEKMRAAGYRTTMVASNHFLSPDFGFGEGFDRHAQYGGSSVQGGEKAGKVVANLLEREPIGEGEPLFMVVHFIDAHIPYRFRTPGRAHWDPPTDLEHETESYRGRTTIKVPKLNDDLRSKPESLLNLYDADIAHADGVFQQVLESIGDAGVIVTADHGEEFDDHGYFEHGHHVWQALVHVPLLVRPPGVASDPQKIDAAASIADVYPTIMDWAGIDAGDVDGMVLDPARLAEWGDRLVWIEHQHLGPERTGYRKGYQKVIYSLPVGWLDDRVSKRRDPLNNGKPRKDSSPMVKTKYPVEAGGKVYDISQDAAELEPRELSPTDPLLAPIQERIRDRFPGLHVECARPTEEPLTLRFESDVNLVRVSPLSLSLDDDVDIPGDHHSITVTLKPDAEPDPASLGTTPWFALEAVDNGEVRLAGELPEGCKVWLNEHRGGSVNLDEESQQMLEDLGYMGH
jgi:arylsulfatase A-like enzyme